MDEAAEAVVQRRNLQAEAEAARTALEQWDPEGLADEVQATDQAAQAALADVQRRASQSEERSRPATLDETERWLEEAESGLRSGEAAEDQARAARDRLREESRSLGDSLVKQRADMVADKSELTKSGAELNLLIETHGAESPRQQALEAARGSESDAKTLLEATRDDIAALQPDLLEADRERFARALSEAKDQKQSAITAQEVSKAKLESEGTVDPAAGLSLAEARLDDARERLAKIERRAYAIRLVDSLFREEQQALADRFSRPLAEKISEYLQALFGPEAAANVAFRDNPFQGVELVRGVGEGAVEFSALSGGTRGQVAAAVRLAMAELLAADHDGTLPIVFDDSFAYSDPDRVQTLQRMLDLASRRGLQVIVVTCDPTDYVALGARQVILPAVRPRTE